LNFKGVQTFLEKSGKFFKIPFSHDILEYNFTLTHLYSNIGSFFTSGKNDCEIHSQCSWPLRDIGPSNISTPLIQILERVFQTELSVLISHQVDMQTPSPKIEEDMQFPKVLPIKQFSGKTAV
jgi:hypothetical protein